MAAADGRAIAEATVRSCVSHGWVYAAAYLREAGDRPIAAEGERPSEADLHREPMVVDGRAIGSLEFAFGPSSDGSDRRLDLRAARALGELLGPAVLRADAFSAQHRVADRLQRALLPAGLPLNDSIEFHAAYRPATDETEVGGDWYDAFDIGDGRIGISIGDVAGHGLDAAVAMGEARQAIRTAAAGFTSPAELLDYVNGILPLEGGAGMATAIAGFYDPSDRTFRYASAGHPPPIMIGNDGRPHVLPGGGLPLGLAASIASPDWTVTIYPDTSVVMYTDGLLEYTRDILVGERILHETVAATDWTRIREPAEALHDAIFASVDNTDDAATLVLRGAGAANDLRLRLSSFPGAAAIARGSVRRYMSRIGAQAPTVERVLYAVGEAVANAIEHGRSGGSFEVNVERDESAMHVEVRNEGSWREFVANDERGRGLPIMQAFAERVAITTTSVSTGIRLTFAIADPAG